jgi:hypothetical protein
MCHRPVTLVRRGDRFEKSSATPSSSYHQIEFRDFWGCSCRLGIAGIADASARIGCL